jgi:hypothetical protein
VDPVSLQHSDVIDPESLDGVAADVFPDYLRRELEAGERSFVLLPLFFGQSRALTSFIPDQKSLLEDEFGVFELRLASPLYPLPEVDYGLGQILLQQINRACDRLKSTTGHNAERVVLVDHGSPVEAVNRVRHSIAEQLQSQLNLPLDQACMERRPGVEYDFNGELLADWLRRQAVAGVRRVVISMLFLLPGRHAGPGGDVASICQSVVDDYPGLQIEITPLVAQAPQLIDLLERRLHQALEA